MAKRHSSIFVLLVLTSLLTSCGEKKSPFARLFCWGGGLRAIAQPPSNAEFLDFDVTSNFVCGATTKNALTCGGDKIGLDASVANYPEGAQAQEVKLRFAVGCIIDTLGRPYCWGSAQASNVPPSVYKGKYHALRIKPSIGDFACALDESDAATCWGKDFGQNFSWLSSLPPAGIKNLEIGHLNVCWSSHGEQAFHCTPEFGIGAPVTVLQAGEVKQLIIGAGRVCTIVKDELNCYNMSGQLISHDDNTSYMATDYATCFIRSGGEASCFDIEGGSPQPFTAAGMVPKDMKFRSVRVGGSTACGAMD